MMKEKSKNAAKTRREKEKVEFQELARLLPLPDTISGQLDKASVIRLATAFLRLRRLLSDNDGAGGSSSSGSMNQRSSFVNSSSTSQFQHHLHHHHHHHHQNMKSLTDTSNTFIQPKLPVSTPPPCSATPFDPSETSQSTGKFNGSWQAGQQLAQALDGFVMVVGADGKLIYVSEAASLHLGLSQVEMTGQPIGEYLHQADHAELASLINFYKAQLLSVHNQQDFRIPVSIVLRMKCVLAKRNAGIVHGGNKVIHCVGYLRSIPQAPPVQQSTINGVTSSNGWPPQMQGGGYMGGSMMSTTSPSPPNPSAMSLSLGNGMFIEDRTNDLDERRTSSSAGSGGARVPSPHMPQCPSPPLPSFAPFAMYLVGISVPPASATELRLASSSLFMLRTTLEMKLLFVETPRVTELLGYEPQDLIEKNLYNLIHCDDLRSFRANHQLLLEKTQCVTCYFRVLTRDGGWVWVQSIQTIVSNSRSSRPHCIVSVNHVISQDQQIFSPTAHPAASFLPCRKPSTSSSSSTSSSILQPSSSSMINIPDAVLAADHFMGSNRSQQQLLVPTSLRNPAATPTLIKPSPVTAVSAFHPQPALSESTGGFRSNHPSGFSSTSQSSKQGLQVAPSDESSNRNSLITATNSAWQQRPLVPQQGFAEPPSPFHHTKNSYQNYHMGGFMSTSSNGGTDFFTNAEYSFFNKAGLGAMSGMESYEKLFSSQNGTDFQTTPNPMTPMSMTPTSALLNTPAPTPGGTSSNHQRFSQGGTESQGGSNSSLQLVGGIHAHTINYTLHIENFNAHASAGAASSTSTSSTTSTSSGQNVSAEVNSGSGVEGSKVKNTPESVASAVASATAGLVLGAAPTTILMCNNNTTSNGTSGNAANASSCWFADQQMMSNSSSYDFPTWQSIQQNSTGSSPQNNRLMAVGGGNGGLKRPFNASSAYSTSVSSPFSSAQNYLHSSSHASSGGIMMAPQPPSGVLEPLAKRIATAPTASAWLNTLQQQP